jgi:hypothetical protein
VCVETDNGNDDQNPAAVVRDIQSVFFVNALNDSLRIPLIDDEGMVIDDNTTNKTCNNGKCQFITTTVPSLYEDDVNGDGILEDVADNAWIQGTAILEFASAQGSDDTSRRRKTVQLMSSNGNGDTDNRGTAAEFALKVSLVPPPPRPRRGSGNGVSTAWAVVGIVMSVVIVSGLVMAAIGVCVNKSIMGTSAAKNW